jgi:hypothetical protein
LEMIAKIEHVDHESVAAHANSVLRLCDDGALLLGRFRYQYERAERAEAERDALRAAVEKLTIDGRCTCEVTPHATCDFCQLRAALARGPAAGETTDGGGKD